MTAVAHPVSRAGTVGLTGWAVLLGGLLLLLDAPLWLVTLVPAQDGPVHLAQADMIARFGWGGALPGLAASFLQWNPRVEPNSAIYVLLAGLIRLTGNPFAANTLFLSLYGALWTAAAALAARTQTSRPVLPTLLLLPLAFGLFIHWGFYNYALGIPLFLLFVAAWRRLDGRRDWRAFAITAAGLLALCLTHLAVVIVACLFLAADGLARAARRTRETTLAQAGRGLVADGLWSVGAALPALVLVGSFVLAYQGLAQAPAEAGDGGRLGVIRMLLGATYLYSFTAWEIAALAPLLGAVALAGVLAARRLGTRDLLWPVFLVLLVALALLDLRLGASLSERLGPFTWIAAVMTLASRQPGPRLRRALCVAALLGLAGQTAVRTVAYRAWSGVLDAEIAAGRAHPGETFAGIDLIRPASATLSWHVRPALHGSQVAALAAGGIGLSSPLPSTRFYGYFPLQYRPEHDFMRATQDWEADPAANRAAVSAFRAGQSGAPTVLIGAALDQDLPGLAASLGYAGCSLTTDGPRTLAACGAEAAR